MCLEGVWGGVRVTLNHDKSSDETARNIGYCFNRLVPFLSIEWHSGDNVKSFDKNPFTEMLSAGSFSTRCLGMSECFLEGVWEESW